MTSITFRLASHLSGLVSLYLLILPLLSKFHICKILQFCKTERQMNFPFYAWRSIHQYNPDDCTVFSCVGPCQFFSFLPNILLTSFIFHYFSLYSIISLLPSMFSFRQLFCIQLPIFSSPSFPLSVTFYILSYLQPLLVFTSTFFIMSPALPTFPFSLLMDRLSINPFLL